MKKSIIKSAKTKDLAIKEALLEINKSIDEVEVEVLEEESSGFLGLIGQKDALVKIIYEDDFKEDLDQIKEDLGTDSLLGDVDDLKDETIEEELEEEKNDQNIKAEKKEEIKKEESSRKEEIEEKEEIGMSSEERKIDKQQDNIAKYYRAKEFLTEILENMHFTDISVIGTLEGNIIKLDAKIDEKDTGIAIGRGGKTIDAIELILRKSLRTRANDLKINIDINNYKRRRDEKIIDQADRAARRVLKTGKRWNLRYMNSYERRLAHEQISKYDELRSYSEGQEPNRFVVVDVKE